MTKFKCNKCNHIFNAKGVKQESIHPIYGPTFKRVAYCPKCKSEAEEYISRGTLKTGTGSFSSTTSSGSSCATGNCPFV